MFEDWTTTEPRVAEALNIVEEGLGEAFKTAIDRIQAVLAGEPGDTEALYRLQSTLSKALANFESNKRLRAERIARI